ncbi:muramidase family protein [Neobacillus niacini]|uniref:muramidase family protein n=1 Tax=Neobacillus niacini TaxID=86668 RepID=UPI00203BA923|nr:LysM peptidoglycan-binding domain-containing protein [Neobacillus niacini]MCM3694549.1 LysM peptidoglycan-binding domain-containing protein [Neobacillus niacini]
MNVQRHEIRKLNPLSDEFTLFIYLDDHLSEFAVELGSEPASNKSLQATAKQILKERYPGLKVTMIKVILGGMAVTSISLSANDSNAVQAADNPANVTQTDGNSATVYSVVAGDTVYGISKRFGTTPEALRSINHLVSDFLQIGQVLTIPASGVKNYTVVAEDTLYSISNRFGTTVAALRSTNNLTSDILSIGQTLTIPATSATPASPSAPTQYTVVMGDTLYSISNRFGTTVSALKSANNLTSDILSIGQSLTIPTAGATPTVPSPPSPVSAPSQYTVVLGDTLYSISNRFGTSVSALRSANNLTSDILSIGQTLTIPTAGATTTQPPGPTPTPLVKEERKTFLYTVKSGDSLSVIAKRYAVSVDSIQAANHLNSDFIQVGQALTIPDGLNAPSQTGTNTITYTTHTIASGENIWDLSLLYGIPQAELLKANNLTTSSMLSIDQKLKIPVHNIGVKEVVSVRHGEYMDWWTEAQYVFTIGKSAKVTDFETGRSFYIKRTIGANHADSETVTTIDSNIAKSIWGGFSWTPRAVLLEVNGRKLAASMSFMPHEREFIANNGITGHFDVYFGNSTRHVDGKADAKHQAQVEKAAGIR